MNGLVCFGMLWHVWVDVQVHCFGMSCFWHVSFRFDILGSGLVCFGMFWHVCLDVQDI